ncbi:radical SAM protein [Paenibacillus sp. 1-18]|uniref:radical SAM protein n=1 Tax=Paenibacillus sp. 1-18 TaxID=1333846 RepID=UPI001E638D64|nr:radical SAM protein [Paenibacillus sp. 1-18]
MENRFNETRYQNQTLNLTILPTFSCNFRCPYCFENLTSKSGKSSFSQKIQNEILTFIEESIKKLNIKRIVVNWTGGEPLLEFKKITILMERINLIADENKINVAHFMVSNGYLLTVERAKILSELGVKRIQITIDGSKASHDQRRILANQEGTFDKIMRNIEDSCDFIHITLRTNVDLNNIQSMDEYMEYMGGQIF